jgi:deoxyribonuclease V
VDGWPATADELRAAQLALAHAEPPPWQPPAGELLVAGCFACFARGGGRAAEAGWAAAALVRAGRLVASAVAPFATSAAYEPGLLALREGAPLEQAVRELPEPPDVLLVNATGRDHPRRAGLALQLGARLGVPTVGVTHRPLVATGAPPGESQGARSRLRLDAEHVGYWLRTRAGARPLAVSAAWRTDPDVAAAVVLAATRRARTPEPLREARRLARAARAAADVSR